MTAALSPTAGLDQGKKWTLEYFVGVFWITYWIANLYAAFAYIIPFLTYYVATAVLLSYVAFARPTWLIQVATKPMIWVWALTAAIPVVMLIDSSFGGYSTAAYKVRIVYFSAVGGTALVLLKDNRERLMHDAAILSLWITVVLNFVDLIVTLPMSRAPDRAAGLWADPNIAAAALCSLLIISVNPLRASGRDLLIVAVTMLAILITFSRSGMIFGAFLAVIYLVAPDRRTGPSLTTRISIALGAALALTFISAIAMTVLDLQLSSTWRITSLLEFDASDASSESRLDRLFFSLDRASDFFWTGRGLGAGTYYGVYSHNSYIGVLYDYGIAGLTLYVLLISQGLFQMIRYGWKRALVPGLLSLNLLYYSMFAHTVHTAAGISVAVVIFMMKMFIDPVPTKANQSIESLRETNFTAPAGASGE
jgi:O-antigen ligase